MIAQVKRIAKAIPDTIKKPPLLAFSISKLKLRQVPKSPNWLSTKPGQKGNKFMDQTDDRTKSIDRNTGMCSKLHRKLREKETAQLTKKAYDSSLESSWVWKP